MLQDAEAQLPHAWRIDTRYYSVDVQLAASKPDWAQQPPEALLLVCSASDEASFTACQRWQETFAQVCEVQLLIVNKWDVVSGDEEPSWLQGCQEWCTEEGFELVQVGLAWARRLENPLVCECAERWWLHSGDLALLHD